MTDGRRTTDFGTVVLHAALVIAFAVLAATGLRIASDDPDHTWLQVLDPVLPTEHLWFRHLAAGLVLAAVLAGYWVYMLRARLLPRVRFDRPRLLAIFRPGRQRFAAINVLVYWLLMAALMVATGSGFMLFAQGGQPLLTIHLVATYVSLVCIVLHVTLHAAAGGLAQIARIVRPARLVIAPPPPDLAELLAQQLAKNAKAAARPTAGPSPPGNDASPRAVRPPQNSTLSTPTRWQPPSPSAWPSPVLVSASNGAPARRCICNTFRAKRRRCSMAKSPMRPGARPAPSAC